MTEERTIFVGGTHAEAVAWCRENGVKPYARTTRIFPNRGGFRTMDGLRILPEDRILWHQDTDPRLAETVRRLLLKSQAVGRG